MNVRELLGKTKARTADIEDTQKVSKDPPYEDPGHTRLGHHRKPRSGLGETMFCQGKPGTYLLRIYRQFYERDEEVLETRATGEQFRLVQSTVPKVAYDPISRILKVGRPSRKRKGPIAVCTGGMADIPVAEEVARTAEYFGCVMDQIFDVGVAGIHRLLSQRDRIVKASCIIAIAGMGGALGTVIAGLTDCPVIAVPASVGYGASFHGLSALLTMLDSCVNGISVVNINNGYGAGCLAAQVNRLVVR